MYKLLFVAVIVTLGALACTSETIDSPRVRTFATSMELAIGNQDRDEMLRLCELGDDRFIYDEEGIYPEVSSGELTDWGYLIAVCDKTINQGDWAGASSELDGLLG